MLNKEQQKLVSRLEEMAAIDIHEAKPETLVDISTVSIDPNLPTRDRITDYINQIRNPYCYTSHGIVVKISFAGKKKLEDCLKEAMIV